MKTCGDEVAVSKMDQEVKYFNCELKRDFEYIHDLKFCALDYGIVLNVFIKIQ